MLLDSTWCLSLSFIERSYFIVYLHNLKLPTRVTLHLDLVFIGMSHKFCQTEYKLNILLEKSPEDQLAHLWSHMIHDWQNVIKKKQQTVKVSHDAMKV